MDTGNAIPLFQAERQMLAMMEHLHIARVLNAGITDAGLPSLCHGACTGRQDHEVLRYQAVGYSSISGTAHSGPPCT